MPVRHIINSLNHREIIIMPKSQINSDIDQSKLTEDELDDLLDQQSMSIHAEIFQNECDKLGLTPEELNKRHISKLDDK